VFTDENFKLFYAIKMNSDILDLLKGQTGRVLSVKEVSQQVDADRYGRDKTWAAGELKGLCSKGFIESINGCYWIPSEDDKNAARLEKEREENEQERVAALTEESPATDKK
jgi:hypothetical protein